MLRKGTRKIKRWDGAQGATSKVMGVGNEFYVQPESIDFHGQEVVRPKFAWGLVKPVPTTDRESPPKLEFADPLDSAAKVQTPYSFYDAGHLVALSLGGSDDPENLTYQASHTNRMGQWHKMEDDLGKHALDAYGKRDQHVYFGVALDYAPGPPATLEALQYPTAFGISTYELPQDYASTHPSFDITKYPPGSTMPADFNPIDTFNGKKYPSTFSNAISDADLKLAADDLVAEDARAIYLYQFGKDLTEYKTQIGDKPFKAFLTQKQELGASDEWNTATVKEAMAYYQTMSKVPLDQGAKDALKAYAKAPDTTPVPPLDPADHLSKPQWMKRPTKGLRRMESATDLEAYSPKHKTTHEKLLARRAEIKAYQDIIAPSADPTAGTTNTRAKRPRGTPPYPDPKASVKLNMK
jgi:hypothetical protein